MASTGRQGRRLFGAVAKRHGDEMACGRGCTTCCQQDLSVLPVEALAIVEHLEQLPRQSRDRLARRAAKGGPPCAFLDDDGGCAIYPARPLVCRTHGLPLRQTEIDDRPASQAHPGDQLSVCPLNFQRGVPPDAVLNATTLLATLSVIDSLTREQLALKEARVSLRDLARHERGAVQD